MQDTIKQNNIVSLFLNKLRTSCVQFRTSNIKLINNFNLESLQFIIFSG